jgi:hypothetical protein
MPPKRSHSLFARLSRMRSRVRRIKAEVSRLISVAKEKDLKFQLREARGLLLEAEDMMTPTVGHEDQQLVRKEEPAPELAHG